MPMASRHRLCSRAPPVGTCSLLATPTSSSLLEPAGAMRPFCFFLFLLMLGEQRLGCVCREFDSGISAVWRDFAFAGEFDVVAPPCSRFSAHAFPVLILLVTRVGLASHWCFFDRPAGIVAAAFGESFPAGCFLKHFHSRSRTENWRPQRCTWFECHVLTHWCREVHLLSTTEAD